MPIIKYMRSRNRVPRVPFRRTNGKHQCGHLRVQEFVMTGSTATPFAFHGTAKNLNASGYPHPL